MKTIFNLTAILILLNFTNLSGQANTILAKNAQNRYSKLSIEPALGINPMPLSDIVASNLVQWDVNKRFAVVARSAMYFNTVFARNFNYIHTDYNYSLSQTIGVGTSFYGKRVSHTISLLGGLKFDDTKETMNNPEFEKVSFGISTLSPDFGLMYNVKLGSKKYFFSCRIYLPLYPYPLKNFDINMIDGNIANTSLEFGLGIRLN